MTAKEYLRQAYRLDQRINSDIRELERLRIMSTSVSSPLLGERVQTTRATDAPFVRVLDKIMEMEAKINAEIDLFVDLKDEIRTVINRVPDTDKRMVLRYRYIHGFTWERIGVELNADARTIRRWHGNALQHVVVPEEPIVI